MILAFSGIPVTLCNLQHINFMDRKCIFAERTREIIGTDDAENLSLGSRQLALFLKLIRLNRHIRYNVPKSVIRKSQKMEVSSVRIYGTSDIYAECPACSAPLEREYVNYCSCCGQRLAWNQFCKGNIKVKSPGTAAEQREPERSLSGCISGEQGF